MIHINELERLSSIAAEYRDIEAAQKLAAEATEDKCDAIILLKNKDGSGVITVPVDGAELRLAIDVCRARMADKIKKVRADAKEAGLHLGLAVAN